MTDSSEDLLISEVKLLLAEKRTYLAMLRTGVAVFGLSVTALGVLVLGSNATIFTTTSSLVTTGVLILIAISGGWMVVQSRQRINHIDDIVEKIEEKNKRIAEVVI